MRNPFEYEQTPETDRILANDPGDNTIIYELANALRRAEKDRSGLCRAIRRFVHEDDMAKSLAAYREMLAAEKVARSRFSTNGGAESPAIEFIDDDNGEVAIRYSSSKTKRGSP